MFYRYCFFKIIQSWARIWFLAWLGFVPAALIACAFCSVPELLWVYAATCCANSCTTTSVSSIKAITLIFWLPTHTTAVLTSWQAAADLANLLHQAAAHAGQHGGLSCYTVIPLCDIVISDAGSTPPAQIRRQ